MTKDIVSKIIVVWLCYILGFTLLFLSGGWKLVLGVILMVLGRAGEEVLSRENK